MREHNQNQGWVKLHRRVQHNPLWLSEPFSRGQAWIDLIMLANHKPGYLRVRGNRIDLNAGDVARSKDSLATRWRWSRGKVLRFLKELEQDEQIEQRTVHSFTVVTLCNYSEYQETKGPRSTPEETLDDTTDRTADRTTDGRQTEQQTVHIQEQQQWKERQECKENTDIVSKNEFDQTAPDEFDQSEAQPAAQNWGEYATFLIAELGYDERMKLRPNTRIALSKWVKSKYTAEEIRDAVDYSARQLGDEKEPSIGYVTKVLESYRESPAPSTNVAVQSNNQVTDPFANVYDGSMSATDHPHDENLIDEQ